MIGATPLPEDVNIITPAPSPSIAFNVIDDRLPLSQPASAEITSFGRPFPTTAVLAATTPGAEMTGDTEALSGNFLGSRHTHQPEIIERMINLVSSAECRVLIMAEPSFQEMVAPPPLAHYQYVTYSTSSGALVSPKMVDHLNLKKLKLLILVRLD